MDIMLPLQSFLLSVGLLIGITIVLAGIMLIMTRFIDDWRLVILWVYLILLLIGIAILFCLKGIV
jgi:hypothetical protein